LAGSAGRPGTGWVPAPGSEKSIARVVWSSCTERPSGRSTAISGSWCSTVDVRALPPATTRSNAGEATRTLSASKIAILARLLVASASAPAPPRRPTIPVRARVDWLSAAPTTVRVAGSTAVSVMAAVASESAPLR
jgi:hypothetical protein